MMHHAPTPKLLAHCPLCQVLYPSSEVRLLGEKGATRLFHCTCVSCGHAVFAVVLETAGAVSSIGLVTDVDAPDALRFHQAKPVSSDECIACHTLMEADSLEFCRRLLDKKA